MTILPFLALWMTATAGPAPCPLPGGATLAAACKCGYPTVEDAFAQSRAVFSGVVLEVRDIPPAIRTEVVGPDSVGNVLMMFYAASEQAVTLRVTRGWKGAQPGDVVAVRDMIACGVGFRTGEEYLVYGYMSDEGALVTSPCLRTRVITPPPDSTHDFRLPPTGVDIRELDAIVRERRS